MNQNTLEKKQIIKLFTIAMAIGTFLVLAAVMPAEYGIDPLGTGKVLGLDKLYESQESSAPDKKVEESTSKAVKQNPLLLTTHLESAYLKKQKMPKEVLAPEPDKQYQNKEDELTITIPANKGLEYKIKVKKHGQLKYEWNSGDITMLHDFHGDPLTAEKTGWYQSYTIAYSNNMVGNFLAPFTGKHGWYFKNHTSQDVKVKIRLKGQYELIQ
ncbi:hypothetical protein EYV94_28405 [Puteibacter caeruleilacunae]|nr:hypothetical protein EYV94_28405 [Puteibacter caeruleilacunae]